MLYNIFYRIRLFFTSLLFKKQDTDDEEEINFISNMKIDIENL
jgi:hypothetical protein